LKEEDRSRESPNSIVLSSSEQAELEKSLENLRDPIIWEWEGKQFYSLFREARTKEVAEEVALIGSRQIFYARLPEVKGTAGTAAFLIDGVLPAPPAYEWTLNHVIPVDDPMELFTIYETLIG